MNIEIEFIRNCIKERKVLWTKHCLNRLDKRDILIKDVKYAIFNGKIIEYYYEDYPFPSCLILGYNINITSLHYLFIGNVAILCY